MDFVTFTADQFAALAADAFVTLNIEAVNFDNTLSGDRYLAIARFYAEAYEGQVALITPIDAAVQQLRCQDHVNVTTDLLGTFSMASKLATTKYETLDGYLGAVRAIQQHVEATSGLSVAEWIAEAVEGSVIPYAWSLLSKQAGYDIDSVIDWTTESSSSD